MISSIQASTFTNDTDRDKKFNIDVKFLLRCMFSEMFIPNCASSSNKAIVEHPSALRYGVVYRDLFSLSCKEPYCKRKEC